MSSQTMQAEADMARPSSQPHLRLWPGIVLMLLVWAGRIMANVGPGSPTQFMFGLMFIPLGAFVLLNVWWLFASRLPWSDRLWVFGILAAAVIAAIVIGGNDFPFMAHVLYTLPVVVTVWVGWLMVTPMLKWPTRRTGLLLLVVAAISFFPMLRVEGMDGAFNPKISWRWTPTAEQQHLAELKSAPKASKPDDSTTETQKPVELELQSGDWPEFRGPQRDSRLSGVRIQTDWEKTPPKQLWKHRIGPGWSSFSVVGDRLFTQEQRGDDELVICYDVNHDGREIWSHANETRFTELVAGPGPRGTPTFHKGRIFALGANGRLNCLDAATGKLIWDKDIVQDSGAKIPMWGFSSSPLVVDGLVTVFAGGPESKSVLAYREDSGDLAWAAGDGTLSYCSTQLNKINGVDQLLMITDVGMYALQPKTGEILWQHSWPSEGIARVVQPALIGTNDLLIGTGMGIGTRRINIKLAADKWETTESWTSRAFKPYYNDYVVLNDHLYGFDGNIFLCADVNDGKVKWKTRGYGNGQVLLLVDQALLLILTEQGEVVLLEAKPEKGPEIGRFKAIEGKTWNHPVVAHGKLFVRNAEEVACFELPMLEGTSKSATTEAGLK